MTPMLRLLRTGLALLLACLAACGPGERAATPAELRRALESADTIEVQLAGPLADASWFQAALRTLEARSGKHVVTTPHVGAPRVVLGGPDDAVAAALFVRLGGALGEAPEFDGLTLRRGGARLVVCAEDPERPGLPLTLHFAGQVGGLAEAAEDLTPGSRTGAVLVQRSATLQLPGEPRREQALGAPLARPIFLLRPTERVARARLQDYSERVGEALEMILGWTGARPVARFELRVFADAAELRAAAGISALTGTDGLRHRGLALLARGVPDDDGAIAARWAAREVLGAPTENWMLDGAAIDAAGAWWGRSLPSWCQQLAAANVLPPVAELVKADADLRYSQHQLAPARGAFFRWLRSERSAEELRALWRGEVEYGTDGVWNDAFRAWLLPGGDSASDARPERVAEVLARGFQVGVALDSNVSPGGGYDAREVRKSLAMARAAGANAVSITTYASESPAPRALLGGRVPPGLQQLEGDAAIAQAVASARAAGLDTVLLQAHLLSTPSGGYSAWMRRTTVEHWDEFFDAYEPWLLHQALLAELLEVDVLCLGTALSSANANGGLAPAAKAHHDERWAAAIALARSAFGGALTYAATAGGEARSVANWDALDFIGVSLFPRFAGEGAPQLGERKLEEIWGRQLEIIDELARRVGKPALVIEVGVRSTERGVVDARIGDGALDLEVQRRAWSTLGASLAARRAKGASGAETLAGLFAWKWSAEPTGGGALDRGFTLTGKPAADLLRALAPTDG